MRARDLVLDQLLDFESEGGSLRFVDQRALILDTAALGLLRRELVELLGLEAARGVMTRFGYAHGWRTAEYLERKMPWASVEEWRRAGGRLHRLQGALTFEPVHRSQRADPPAFTEAIWRDSYEAEQHLLHFGRAEVAVCWTSCGFASGYLSRANGQQIYCVESSCRGRGDALCRMRGDARDRMLELGHGEELTYFEQRELDDAGAVRGSLRRLERQLQAQRRGVGSDEAALEQREGIVARSPAMRELFDLARRVAAVDSTLLLSGPRGAGKERLARFVHQHSSRAGGPFVALTCGAMPEQLLESELFGHCEGAFAGATRERPGLFEAAHTGTLLLDEIGELTAATQARLLRVLETGQLRRVGEDAPRRVDVRMIAATQRDLGADVLSGRFAEALYHLHTVELRVPPLAARREDILPLARVLLAAAGRRLSRPLEGFSPGACRRLVAHDWPGDVRELQSAVEHAVALARGRTVEAGDLPRLDAHLERRPRRRLEGSTDARNAPPQLETSLDMSLAEVERRHILAVLEAAGGNKAEAARRLEIGTATLFRRLKQYREGAGLP